MSDPLKKVRTGDPLVVPAQAYNAFIDAARDFQQRTAHIGQTATPGYRSAGIVLVKNESGAARERFDVLGLGDPVILPDVGDTAEQQFKNAVALRGELPDETLHKGKFVILAEPLATGAIGRAYLAGVTVVRLRLENSAQKVEAAEIIDADATALQPAPSGSAAVLWHQEQTGDVWAVVRLGNAAGTHDNPKVLGGSGDTADTEEWDVDGQEEGCDGVQFSPIRLYWSGTSGDPVYQFIRTPTYDSIGRLVHVPAEVRSTAFGTGNCEGA